MTLYDSLLHAADLTVYGMCKQVVFKRSGWKYFYKRANTSKEKVL